MELLEISKNNLEEIEEIVLNTSREEFDKIFKNDEYLFKIMELTKNRKVFLKCMDFIMVPFLVEKIRNPETSLEMVFKLTLHNNPYVQSAILSREDVTPALLKQMIENFEDEETLTTRSLIINHKVMDEETLYSLCDCNNNQILSQIILTDKVSDRILKKLQKSEDDEIRKMAKVRDPEADFKDLDSILREEFKNAIEVDAINKNRPTTIVKEVILNDILEAGIRNPNLPSKLVNLYKKTEKLPLKTLVIPHPNISKELLDYYLKNGDDDVKEAVLKRDTQNQLLH